MTRNDSGIRVDEGRCDSPTVSAHCRLCLWLIVVAAVARGAQYSVESLHRHEQFLTGWDLAIFDQATWLLSRGHSPFLTVRDLPFFADHGSVIMALAAPLYWLWSDARTLLALQGIAVAGAGVPLFLLGLEQLKRPWPALVVALLYLAYEPMHFVARADFHPETLAVPLLFLCVLSVRRCKERQFLVFLVLAALCKEQVGLTIAGLGTVLALRRQWRPAAIAVIVGASWFVIATEMIPSICGFGRSLYISGFGYGSSWSDFLANIVRSPGRTLGPLFSAGAAQYYSQLLAPLAFLPLFCPLSLIPTLPTLVANRLGSATLLHSVGAHYVSLIAPFLFVALLDLLSFAHRRRDGLSGGTGKPRGFLMVGLLSLAGLTSLIPHLPVLGNESPGSAPQQTPAGQTHVQALRAAVGKVPPGAPVSAQNRFLPHLSQRKRVYAFPAPFVPVYFSRGFRPGSTTGNATPTALARSIGRSTVEYIVLDERSWHWPVDLSVYERVIAAIEQSGAYELVFDRDGAKAYAHRPQESVGFSDQARTAKQKQPQVQGQTKAP